ncbi:MAG: metallophosphoesterase [Omnitrophica bacterium]|nr:metallophosphoesterase [Candidatus Omnitrophota bacterium]
MKIGIIADTHDNLININEAVKIFNSHKVNFVIHCGDFIAPFALNPFEMLKCDWVGVFGNNDGEKKGLLEKSEGRIKEPPYFLELGFRKIVVAHEFKDCQADIIAFGHTHEPKISKNSKMLINPGEAGGWVNGQPSLVILDLDNMQPELINF